MKNTSYILERFYLICLCFILFAGAESALPAKVECYIRFKSTFSTKERQSYNVVVPVADLRVILRTSDIFNKSPLSIYVRDVFAHDMTTLFKCINIISRKSNACKSHGRNLFTPKYQTIITRCFNLSNELRWQR